MGKELTLLLRRMCAEAKRHCLQEAGIRPLGSPEAAKQWHRHDAAANAWLTAIGMVLQDAEGERYATPDEAFKLGNEFLAAHWEGIRA